MDDRSVRHALRLLCHPASLVALGLLLLNDHLLRRFWPSWWTGKLGDAAWLFFAPFALAVGLAFLSLPFSLRSKTLSHKRLGWLAVSLTGLIFGLVKLFPWAHQPVVQAAEALLGLPVGLRRDPTDLVTLPILAASAWLWFRPEPPIKRRAAQTSPPWAYAVLVASLFLTVANSAAPDYGITCFAQADGVIFANGQYASRDGGLTWESVKRQEAEDCAGDTTQPVTVTDPRDPGVTFRTIPGEGIERTDGSSQAWQRVYELYQPTEAERAYYDKTHDFLTFLDSPVDAIGHAPTGNILFAMSQDGVLVRMGGSGEWLAVAVGEYEPSFGERQITGLGEAVFLLSGELYGALGSALVAVAILALRLGTRRLHRVLAGLAAAIWLALVLGVPVALMNGPYDSALFALALLASALVIVPVAVEALIRAYRRLPLPGFLRLLAAGALAALAFILPYGLWAFSALPQYRLATIFGILLGAAVLFGADHWLQASVPAALQVGLRPIYAHWILAAFAVIVVLAAPAVPLSGLALRGEWISGSMPLVFAFLLPLAVLAFASWAVSPGGLRPAASRLVVPVFTGISLFGWSIVAFSLSNRSPGLIELWIPAMFMGLTGLLPGYLFERGGRSEAGSAKWLAGFLLWLLLFAGIFVFLGLLGF